MQFNSFFLCFVYSIFLNLTSKESFRIHLCHCLVWYIPCPDDTSHVQVKLYKIPEKVSLQLSSSAFLPTLSRRVKLCRRQQIAFPLSFAENSTALFHFFPYLKSPVDLQTAPDLHRTHLQSSPAASPPP